MIFTVDSTDNNWYDSAFEWPVLYLEGQMALRFPFQFFIFLAFFNNLCNFLFFEQVFL